MTPDHIRHRQPATAGASRSGRSVTRPTVHDFEAKAVKVRAREGRLLALAAVMMLASFVVLWGAGDGERTWARTVMGACIALLAVQQASVSARRFRRAWRDIVLCAAARPLGAEPLASGSALPPRGRSGATDTPAVSACERDAIRLGLVLRTLQDEADPPDRGRLAPVLAER